MTAETMVDLKVAMTAVSRAELWAATMAVLWADKSAVSKVPTTAVSRAEPWAATMAGLWAGLWADSKAEL